MSIRTFALSRATHRRRAGSTWLNVVLAGCLATSAAFGTLASDALADDQESEPADEIVVPTEPEIPKRDVQFRESKEPLPMRLFAADPKLLEQKYVATVVFTIPSESARPRHLRSESLRLYASAIPPFGILGQVTNYPFPTVLQRLVDKLPDERSPSPDVLAALADADRHIRFHSASPHTRRASGAGAGELGFQILAADIESTKAKSLALLDLYDYGLSRMLQQELIDKIVELKRVLLIKKAKLRVEEAASESWLKQSEEHDLISDESFADLKTQQRLLSVEEAGVKARIDACTKLLKPLDVRSKKLSEQIESLKVAAEVELAGLTARKEAIGQMIESGTQRRELMAKGHHHRHEAGKIRGAIGAINYDINNRESARKTVLPFPLRDNTITIRPIKWESGDDQE